MTGEEEKKSGVLLNQYQSNDISKLAEALAKAQGNFKHAKKSSSNPFFNSSYADLAAVIDASRPALSANGLSIIHIPDIDEGGSHFLMVQLSHSSGQWIRGRYAINVVGKAIKNKEGTKIGNEAPTPQEIGSGMTYSKRYSYAAISGVAAEGEDDDGNAASGNVVKQTAGANKEKFKKLKEEIMKSDDLDKTWSENIGAINAFKAQDETYFDDLVNAGTARRKELEKMDELPPHLRKGTKP